MVPIIYSDSFRQMVSGKSCVRVAVIDVPCFDFDEMFRGVRRSVNEGLLRTTNGHEYTRMKGCW